MNTKFEISFKDGNGPFEIEEYPTKAEAESRVKHLRENNYNQIMLREVSDMNPKIADTEIWKQINNRLQK